MKKGADLDYTLPDALTETKEALGYKASVEPMLVATAAMSKK